MTATSLELYSDFVNVFCALAVFCCMQQESKEAIQARFRNKRALENLSMEWRAVHGRPELKRKKRAARLTLPCLDPSFLWELSIDFSEDLSLRAWPQQTVWAVDNK